MNNHYQLLVVGAGPAGLAAATTVSAHGVSCALLDEQPAPGGQIYRAVESIPEQRAQQLGEEYLRGRELVQAFRLSGADYFPETRVWSLNERRELGIVRGQKAEIITADRVIVAGGAMERPVPFPGWTLPGVMQAGAGQILFKSSGVVPDNGVVLAGSGPLLLLLAWQYLHAGVEIKALLDLTPIGNHLAAIPKLPKALSARHYLTKGLKYKLDLKRAGVPMLNGVSDLRAEGNECLRALTFRHRGKIKNIETVLLLTHFGVIPHTFLTQAAGCRHVWDDSQQCWRPQHDEWGRTDIVGILVAGDGAAINGARSAEHAGRLAGFAILADLGVINQSERDRLAVEDRRWMREDRYIRPFLEAYFSIPKSLLVTPEDETIVCRCEEISAGQIRRAVAEGHQDSNQVKFFTRCGMGPCQGRQCGHAVAQIVADASGTAISEVGHFRGRPPVAPLSLGQLSALRTKDGQ